MNRHFKKIEEFEDYYVSPNGIFYSKKSNKYLKHNNKYITLHKNGKKYIRSVSKILEISFGKTEIQIDNNYKIIPEFENYAIDQFGNVFSKKSKKIKKYFTNPNGYKCIFLSKNGKLHNKLVHRLVYEAWKGKIEDDMTIDHIDENKNNNHINNLQMLTRSENVLKFHAIRGKDRIIDGFKQIENFENYYINKDGEVLSFKYGEEPHKIAHKDDELYLRKNNKRYYISINYLLHKYFGNEFQKQKNRKYKNID